MPVSPIQKQDLMLVKKAFEDKVLDKDTNGAVTLPMVSSVQQVRRMHETIRDGAANYPAAVSNKTQGKDNQSFLKQKQIECIPCLGRIKALGDLDMADDLFATMMAYNERQLQNMVNLFKTVSRPNQIQQSLCEAYTALRSQCIPDIARLISQLSLLVSYLRGFNLKSLKDQLIGLVGALIVRTLVSGAINYDMYVTLITDVTRCIVHDINSQIAKLEPILSREGLEDIASLLPLDTQDGEISQAEAAEKKAAEWFPNAGDFNYAKDASKAITSAQRAFEKKVNTFNRGANRGVDHAAQVGRLIADTIEESISVVDSRLENATQELLKFLKISDGNMKGQIQLLDQIQFIRSILEVLKTIKDTRGEYDPCGKEAGRNFFTRIKFPGQDVTVDNSDPDNPEIVIVPPGVRVDNPVVEDILNENGIETGEVGDGTTDGVGVKSGRIVRSLPVSVNVSRCLDGKQ